MKKTRLRSRVFFLTAIYALMLLAVTLVLTLRATRAEKEFLRIITVDTKALELLEDIVRNQSAFLRQWKSAIGDPEQISVLSKRYQSVAQLLDSELLIPAETIQLHREIDAFQQRVRSAGASWNALSTERRLSLAEEIDLRSSNIIDLGQRLSGIRRKEIEKRLPALEREGRNAMWAALGIVYIIAIGSFAVARLTLAKVVAPIEQLARAADSIAAENYSARAPVAGDLEISTLGLAFNRMAEALEASRQRLEATARTDELTRLLNFRAFDEAIDAEIERASRFGHAFGLLVLDLDHFKSYNDQFGHLAGNEALQAVSQVIRATVRAVDVPARYGGEEFVIVLPQLPPGELEGIAERIRSNIELLPPIAGRSSLTISVGGALFPDDGAAKQQLFAAADKRLYQAKREGRNRVIVPSS